MPLSESKLSLFCEILDQMTYYLLNSHCNDKVMKELVNEFVELNSPLDSEMLRFFEVEITRRINSIGIENASVEKEGPSKIIKYALSFLNVDSGFSDDTDVDSFACYMESDNADKKSILGKATNFSEKFSRCEHFLKKLCLAVVFSISDLEVFIKAASEQKFDDDQFKSLLEFANEIFKIKKSFIESSSRRDAIVSVLNEKAVIICCTLVDVIEVILNQKLLEMKEVIDAKRILEIFTVERVSQIKDKDSIVQKYVEKIELLTKKAESILSDFNKDESSEVVSIKSDNVRFFKGPQEQKTELPSVVDSERKQSNINNNNTL